METGAQVFDADGGRMQFVVFEAQDPLADFGESKRNSYLVDLLCIKQLGLSPQKYGVKFSCTGVSGP